MLEFVILIGIFGASLWLVKFALYQVLKQTYNTKKELSLSSNNTFEKILDAAAFPVWYKENDVLMWTNRAYKTINPTQLQPFEKADGNISHTYFQPQKILYHKQTKAKYKVFSHHIESKDYYFAFEEKAMKQEAEGDRLFQTFTALFAHLQVGIAVFDHQNELSLFNPALSDHLELRTEWLAQKPNLLSFLDRLRDTHILPEPKNYISWRKMFLKIERSAMKDDYRQNWELPDGRILRVVGRPHSSGTVIFLFEDITATLNMERSFRAQIANFKTAIDATTIGLSIFDRKGNLIFANETLMGVLGSKVDIKTVQDFYRAMQKVFKPTPAWGDFCQFVKDMTERSAWQADIETYSGESVLAYFEPIQTGNTLCEFHFPFKINQDNLPTSGCAAE